MHTMASFPGQGARALGVSHVAIIMCMVSSLDYVYQLMCDIMCVHCSLPLYRCMPEFANVIPTALPVDRVRFF